MQKPKESTGQLNTAFMLDAFHNMRKQLEQLRSALAPLLAPHFPEEARTKASEMLDGLFCFELAMNFYTEANQAIQAHAWFAGSTVAASALEAVLLAYCFGEQDRIKALPKWQKLPAKLRNDFGIFIRSMDLGKLLEIANELGWFPDGGIPQEFMSVMAEYVEPAALVAMEELFAGEQQVGALCSKYVREFRNLLHPAVCLRESTQPSATTGMAATFVFMIAFVAIAKNVKFA